MSHFKGDPEDVFFSFYSNGPPLWALKVGYNLVTIVIIDVPASVGRPKTFDPSIATYVALKGTSSPLRFWKPRGLKGLPPICLVRTAFIGLRASYNWMQIVTADVAILLGRLRIFAPLVVTYVAKVF
ncbi:MAG: hypothetical protein H5T41_09630 [Methanomassiliicoccales archaeon]|nr:hypothetical protein [Methanomassiliicoccales archaeon]